MATDKPRLIGRKEASAYCGIAESTFSLWVATHKLPPAIPGTRKWDRKAIDARLDEIAGLEMAAASAKSPRDEWDEWQKQQKERDLYRPQFNLGSRIEGVLRFMIDHPDCNTTPVIPRAATRTMEQLKELGLVSSGGKDLVGDRIWLVTNEGRDEILREDTFRNWRFIR